MIAFLNDFHGRIYLEQFITKKCNWACRHCMYNCSQESSGNFIDEDQLSKLKTQADFLKSIGFKVIINLLGGEPTLYFNKLQYVLDVISSWGVTITMPTNGWWLENEKSQNKFFDTFKNYVAPNGSGVESNNGNGLFVQISDDQYHREWKSEYNNESNFQQIFENNTDKIPSPHSQYPWIRWKHLLDNYYVNPQGRGKNVSNAEFYIDKLGKSGSLCYAEYNKNLYSEYSAHYELDGKISGSCPFGNKRNNFGSIEDNVIFIMLIEKSFRDFRKNQVYNCLNCNDLFDNWYKKYYNDVYEYYEKLNTLDVYEFINNYEKINEFNYNYELVE